MHIAISNTDMFHSTYTDMFHSTDTDMLHSTDRFPAVTRRFRPLHALIGRVSPKETSRLHGKSVPQQKEILLFFAEALQNRKNIIFFNLNVNGCKREKRHDLQKRARSRAAVKIPALTRDDLSSPRTRFPSVSRAISEKRARLIDWILFYFPMGRYRLTICTR